MIKKKLREKAYYFEDETQEGAVSHMKWTNMDFLWVCTHLLSPHPRVRGCHILIPDMVFFKNGKTCLRIKSDSNNFLIALRSQKALKKTELRAQFPNITRERRKKDREQDELEDLNSDEQEAKGAQNAMKTIKPDPSSISFDKGEAYKEFNMPQGKTLHGNFYRDIAIVQFYNEPSEEDSEVAKVNNVPFISKVVKPVSENEFLKIMSRRPNDDYWKKIEFIQTCIKARRGIGKAIEIDYYPKVNKKTPSKPIHYNFRSYKPDNYLLKNDPELYCQKQVVKMCYYISKIYNYEPLRMKCSFLTDDDGVIYLSNVHK